MTRTGKSLVKSILVLALLAMSIGQCQGGLGGAVALVVPSEVNTAQCHTMRIGIRVLTPANDGIVLTASLGTFAASGTDTCKVTIADNLCGEATLDLEGAVATQQRVLRLVATANGHEVCVREVRLRVPGPIARIDYPKKLCTGGIESDTVRAMVLDEEGNPMAGVPASLVCHLPGAQSVVIAAVSSSDGSLLFNLPCVSVEGIASFNIAIPPVLTPQFDIQYYEPSKGSNGITATIVAPLDTSPLTTSALPFRVSVSPPANGTKLPESITIHTSSGTFLGGTGGTLVLKLQDGEASGVLEVPPTSLRDSIILRAFIRVAVGNEEVLRVIGYARLSRHFPEAMSMQMVASANPLQSGIAGVLKVSVVDHEGNGLAGLPVVLCYNEIGGGYKLWCVDTSSQGEASFPINLSALAGRRAFQAICGGLNTPTESAIVDEKGRITHWGIHRTDDGGLVSRQTYTYDDQGCLIVHDR